jgi:uridylate kinase
MDASAISLSRENKIPIIVFSIHDRGSLVAVLKGQGKATIIEDPA